MNSLEADLRMSRNGINFLKAELVLNKQEKMSKCHVGCNSSSRVFCVLFLLKVKVKDLLFKCKHRNKFSVCN